MNKYSEMSDFEVNKKIANLLGFKNITKSSNQEILVESVSCGYGGFKTVIIGKNYCSYYPDAFNLMIDNNISLTALAYSNKTEWSASAFNSTGNKFIANSINPCRAIAECYLLMKDAEKDNGD
ncbi:hypothetical protein RHO12_03395 [Orbus sturtevantii]|uniref:hypothetical protein n=1 Tax=Orbus sturtevantii TaxID=3074109 RepID=UPI00370D8828